MSGEIVSARQAEKTIQGTLMAAQAIFKAIDGQLKGKPGYRIFTVLLIDVAAGLNRRVYSSHPAEYPLGGAKALLREGQFFRQVVMNGEPRICANREECQQAFFDHEIIFSLGCESAINMPVAWNGMTLGSLNLLDAKGRYGSADTEILKAPAAMAAPALLEFLKKESL